MKIQDFLKHHGISRNPFAEEDAQTDNVFKEHCIDNTFHVGWDKVIGDPKDPSTSIVFGEKGAGKTALRLQIERHILDHNRAHPENRLYVIKYDDFNPFLDRFRDHFGSRLRRADKLLGAWRLWDHMDAILSQAVTQLVDQVLAKDSEISKDQLRSLSHHRRRDMLLLAACYDQSNSEPMPVRWKALRRKLRFWTWKARIPFAIGFLGTLLWLALVIVTKGYEWGWMPEEYSERIIAPPDLPWWGYALILGLVWLPWIIKVCQRAWLALGVVRRFRVGKRYVNPLRHVLMNFTGQDLLAQPVPNKDRTDDRYELLGKLQSILDALGYSGILVLMDRLDEPHLVNGQADLMRAFLWPLLDNKFLKHPGLGIKMMLPIEIRRFIDREDRDFYQRSRLDKQNMIPSLQWTGSALYDLASARIAAVAADGANPSLRELFDESVSDHRLIEAFQTLRVPRHLFKFLYRLLVSHCNAHTEDNPAYEISLHEFESALAVYAKEIEAADTGVGV